MPKSTLPTRPAFLPIVLAWILIAPLSPADDAPAPGRGAGPVDLSPARWPAGELEKYHAVDADFGAPVKLAEGEKAMIATTSAGGTAVRAGLEALRQGGSAVDAALTTALTQITLVLGSWTSYAGVMTMVVYDAESGQVFSLNAAWDTPKNETDPLSIPPAGDGPSGRAVLVPGFMAGVQAAHDRFGVLPFEQLFAPAVYLAEEGFELWGLHEWIIRHRRDVLARRPEALALFTRDDAALYAAGDRLRQPELARTLRAVARSGADYMYRGPWAEKLVAAVQQEGGRLTLNDMKAYRAVWSAPVRGAFGEYEVAGVAPPTLGGVAAVEAFRLLDMADLDTARHYSEHPESLYWMTQIARIGPLLSIAPVRTGYDPATLFGDLDVSLESRAREATTRALWLRMQRHDWSRSMRTALAEAGAAGAAPHSDCVVAMDERGNVVALTHSINTALWGSLALFVDGVSISDPAAHQQGFVHRAGPGRRLPDATNPYLVLQDGRPVVASAAVGNGLHEAAFQNVVNLLVYGMDPRQAIEAPKFLAPFYDPRAQHNREYYKQRVWEGSFDPQVLEALAVLGQEVAVQPAEDQAGMGFWVGLRIDPRSGKVLGGAGRSAGYAEGF